MTCTTDNSNGRKRIERNKNKWVNLGLTPIYVTSKLESAFNNRIKYSTSLLNGQFGCHQTHQRAWREFLKTNSMFILITEDDAFPINGDDLIKEIEIFAQFCSEDSAPKFLQLGHVIFPKLNFVKWIVALSKFIRIKKIYQGKYINTLSYGTHCYLINRSMAEFLITVNPYGILGLDTILINIANSELGRNFDFRRLIFPVCLQERLDSSIPSDQEHKGRGSQKLTFQEKIACLAES